MTKLNDGHNIQIHQTVQFGLSPQTYTIDVPYRDVYGYHPSLVLFTGAVGDPTFTRCQSGANPYTGNFDHDMTNNVRLANTERSREQRVACVLAEGASWEDSNATRYE